MTCKCDHCQSENEYTTAGQSLQCVSCRHYFYAPLANDNPSSLKMCIQCERHFGQSHIINGMCWFCRTPGV